MNITMLKGKIHRATVTQAELNYVGSITVDADLLDAAGILEYEAVQVVNIANGNRFLTYTIAGERGSGVICLNGAAARQAQTGDKVILMSYAQVTPCSRKLFWWTSTTPWQKSPTMKNTANWHKAVRTCCREKQSFSA